MWRWHARRLFRRKPFAWKVWLAWVSDFSIAAICCCCKVSEICTWRKNNYFLEFRALEPYLTAAIIFAKNLQPTIIIIICRLQVPYLVLFYFYSVINVANVSREARHCQLIYWFIRTLGPTPVNTVESAFIKSQTWRNTPTFTPVSLALPRGCMCKGLGNSVFVEFQAINSIVLW